jgi:hypothetical protein
MDVWTTNEALHDYYLKQGFERLGPLPEEYLASIDLPGYPSSALFHRKTKPGGAGDLFVDPAPPPNGTPIRGSRNGAAH